MRARVSDIPWFVIWDFINLAHGDHYPILNHVNQCPRELSLSDPSSPRITNSRFSFSRDVIASYYLASSVWKNRSAVSVSHTTSRVHSEFHTRM